MELVRGVSSEFSIVRFSGYQAGNPSDGMCFSDNHPPASPPTSQARACREVFTRPLGVGEGGKLTTGMGGHGGML